MMTVRACLCGGLTALMSATLTVPARAGDLTIINVSSSAGYQFTNFDAPNAGAGGTTINGISNNGTVVGFTSPDGVNLNNFTANPLQSLTTTAISINNLPSAMANGINSSGTIVGSDGNGNAFSLSGSNLNVFVPNASMGATAFGIDDKGVIVGNYVTAGDTEPGFVVKNGQVTTINAPSGPDTVNAQSINNNGLVVGFYQGNDGQSHGFKFNFNLNSTTGYTGTGTAIADPTIPQVSGEPGAIFMFSQILSVNDQGIAVGYYGDSTGSQHGFLYNTNTGQYSFLDDPNAAIDNGVEVTQITGITNSGELTGFYSDANGVDHGFVATVSTVPEPASVALLGIGLTVALGHYHVRKKNKVAA